MTAAELEAFLHGAFPDDPPATLVEEAGTWGVRLREPAASLRLRPGGTVSGPTLMRLADTTAWLAVLAQIGPVAMAVTTSLHMDFLRKPQPVDTVAEGRLLKLGRRLAITDVTIRSDGDDAVVAKASVTYSIPPGATG